MLRKSLVISISFVAGCSMLKGVGGSKGSDTGWSATMAEAPSYELGKVVEIKKPVCSGSGYTKLDVDVGKPFHIVAKSSGACGAVEIMTGTGAAANTEGNSIEVCGEKGPMTIASVGQEGGTFIGTGERYGCTGITLTLDFKAGAPSAATGTEGGAPAGGNTPAGGEPTEPPTL